MILLKVCIQWLKDYVNLTDDIEKLSDELTMSGSEVEEIEKPFEKIKGVISAKIAEVIPHPNANNLNVCKIAYDGKLCTVVTSDKTVQVNDIVAFAPAYESTTVDGKRIESIEIRGIKTDGVMLSLEEMGLASHSTCVFRFRNEVELGRSIVDLLKLDLTSFELEITPNRPDCLSHVGLAREIAAVERKELKLPEPLVELPRVGVDVSLESSGCWRYMAIRIDEVEVKDSPLWIKRRLASVGLRSINNIADITNYVMMELGHPVHAFDFDKIPSSKIVVRNAHSGEKIFALNSKKYELNGKEILITDGESPIAIAGVIGGSETSVTSSTKNVLLEIATFDPVRVRRASRAIGLSTDASFRFERGVDPNDTELVARRLVDMIIRFAGGRIVGGTDLYPTRIESKKVFLPRKRLVSYTAYDPESTEVVEIFQRLGMRVTEKLDGWMVTVPTFRRDISEDVDLIEEFARIHGLDNLPTNRSLPYIAIEKNDWWDFKSNVKRAMIGLGYYEVVTYPFVDPKLVRMFNPNEENTIKSPKLVNPISPEMSLMRSDLVFGLINATAYNIKHQQTSVRFFEVGKVFDGKSELEKLGIMATGRINPYDYTDKRNTELLNLKGDIESLCELMHIELEFSQKDMSGFEVGRSAEILVNDKVCGVIGELSTKIRDFLDVHFPIYFAEVNLERIFGAQGIARYAKYSTYPVSFKDISMFVEKGKVKAEDIIKIAKKSSEYVMDLKVSDFYIGKNVPKGSYSLTITITYGSMEKTLSEEEINTAFTFLVEELDSKNGVIVRKAL